MRLYKIEGTDIWELGDPALVCVFVEDATQEFLDNLKHDIIKEGIEETSIHTLFFTKIQFGMIVVEEGTFKAEYADNPPDDITAMEDRIMQLLFSSLSSYKWDALWYKEFFSELEALEGLANHVVGFTESDVDFCYVCTEDKLDHPLMFIKNCREVEAETVLSGDETPDDED